MLVAEDLGAAEDGIRAGAAVVTPDALAMSQLEGLECIVEVTGVPDVGARVAHDAIMNRKPVVMMNVETDITIGVYLDRLARKMGSVYTVASGDEPGVLKMLHEQAVLMGFEVVALGKGKNNVIDLAATPEACVAEAASKGMNPKMLSAFKDGTKTMVEMAAVSNATGLAPDVPGMHGPKVEVDELVSTFIPQADGGILSRAGCVDYSTGAIAPGVFADRAFLRCSHPQGDEVHHPRRGAVLPAPAALPPLRPGDATVGRGGGAAWVRSPWPLRRCTPRWSAQPNAISRPAPCWKASVGPIGMG